MLSRAMLPGIMSEQRRESDEPSLDTDETAPDDGNFLDELWCEIASSRQTLDAEIEARRLGSLGRGNH